MNNESKIYNLLKKQYSFPKIALKFRAPMQILVATILSAQCTDKRVNEVTSVLFKKYKTVKDFASAGLKTFEGQIRSTGFYRNKAKNIIRAAKKILEDFNGRVPSTMEKLLALPGVARKTANVILQNAFNKVEGIVVDTHVIRLSNRLGFVTTGNPVKIESVLMEVFPKQWWKNLSRLLITHGRNICNAKRPLCLKCVVAKYCPSKSKFYPV